MKSDLYAKMASHRVYTIKQQKSTRPLNFTPIIYNNNNQSFRLTISIVKLIHPLFYSIHPLFSFVSSFFFFLPLHFDSNYHQFVLDNSIRIFQNPLIICQFSKLFSMHNKRKWYEGKIVDNFRAQEEKRELAVHFRVATRALDCQEFGMTYARRKLDSNL